MKKTYWWRVVILICGIVALSWGYLTVYSSKFGLCRISQSDCLFQYYPSVDSVMFFSIAVISTSIYTFFVNDLIFLKWLRFAIAWIALTIIFVALAPVYTGGFMNFGPTKEIVSIWMGLAFMIISLGKLVWDSRKEKVKN